MKNSEVRRLESLERMHDFRQHHAPDDARLFPLWDELDEVLARIKKHRLDQGQRASPGSWDGKSRAFRRKVCCCFCAYTALSTCGRVFSGWEMLPGSRALNPIGHVLWISQPKPDV